MPALLSALLSALFRTSFAVLVWSLVALGAVAQEASSDGAQDTYEASTDGPAPDADAVLVQIEAPERNLVLVSWGGRYAEAQQAALIEPFARKQDSLSLVKFKGNLESLDRVKADWDLVDLELGALEEACALGLVAPLDPKQVGLQAGGLIPGALHRCGLASQAWSWSFYAPTLDGTESGPSVSVEGFLDPDLMSGTRGLYRRPDGLLEMLMLAQGVPADQVYAALTAPGGAKKALAILEPLKAELKWYHASGDLEAAIASGAVDFAFGYTAALDRAVAKRDQQPTIALAKAPVVYGLDYWALRADSPNQEAGYAFLRHAISPAAGAAFAERLAYVPTRVQAYAGIQGLPNVPKAEHSLVFDRLWWQSPAGLAAIEAFEAWVE